MSYTVEQGMTDWNKPRWEVVRMFRTIDQSGAAKFVTGRKGWPSRLERR